MLFFYADIDAGVYVLITMAFMLFYAGAHAVCFDTGIDMLAIVPGD